MTIPPFTLLDRTPAFGAVADGGASAAAGFLGRWRRLPTFARNYSHHTASVRAPGGAALARTLRWLHGKLVVVNPALDVRVPDDAADEARRLMGELGAAGGGRADWFALTLEEPAAIVIRHQSGAAPSGGDAGRDARFFAEVPYRLTLYAGRGAPTAVAAAGPGAVGEGWASAPAVPARPWFNLALHTPDDDALRHMTSETALFYKGITGRLGPQSRDSYWYLEAWERFRERGRLVGHVVPDPARHGRAGGGEAWRPRSAAEPMSYDDFLFGSGGGYGGSRWQELTPTFDRRTFVPPGYCLVEHRCWVEVAVVRVTGEE